MQRVLGRPPALLFRFRVTCRSSYRPSLRGRDNLFNLHATRPTMATINGLSRDTGFSRNAIRDRVKRFNLGEDFEIKDVLQLIPLDDRQRKQRSLEEERADLAHHQGRKAKMEADMMDGKLVEVEEFYGPILWWIHTQASLIKSANMPEETKEAIFHNLNDHILPDGKWWETTKGYTFTQFKETLDELEEINAAIKKEKREEAKS